MKEEPNVEKLCPFTPTSELFAEQVQPLLRLREELRLVAAAVLGAAGGPSAGDLHADARGRLLRRRDGCEQQEEHVRVRRDNAEQDHDEGTDLDGDVLEHVHKLAR
jgi:hypothetical protein